VEYCDLLPSLFRTNQGGYISTGNVAIKNLQHKSTVWEDNIKMDFEGSKLMERAVDWIPCRAAVSYPFLVHVTEAEIA